MRKPVFSLASTLDDPIKLGHGHVWISCWIVFQKFVVSWQWADFRHLCDMLKSRNRLYHWYAINLTEQTAIIEFAAWAVDPGRCHMQTKNVCTVNSNAFDHILDISNPCSHVVLLPEIILYFLWIDISKHGLFCHNCNTLASLYLWLACKPESLRVSRALGLSS